MGDLPLPQISPHSRKREREWDSPSSSNASDLTPRPMSQNPIPTRVTAGSRRVRKEPSFIDHTQQIQTPLPQHQQSQTVSSTTRQSNIPLPPSQQAPSRSRSHSQIRPNESKKTTFVPYDTAAAPVFALPVYSNDLGRLPLHAQMSFGAQAHLPQSQTNSLQLDQESYWDTSSEPPSQANTSGAGTSYRPHYPSAPVPEQQSHPRRHHVHQDIPECGFPPASEATSMLQGMGAPEMASGMLFDAMERSGSHYQHQHQAILQQHGEPALSDPFILDNDAAAVWSNVPTGFQCVIVVLFSATTLFIHCLPC